jgi:predicted kinase
MKRLVIITVGKTHSGKTTFAQALERQLPRSLVIDQDHHADFINAFYKRLVPKQGPNTIKYAITQTVVDFAVNQTDLHLILCNANRNRTGRMKLLADFQAKGFIRVLVSFEIPDSILQARIAASERSTTIFRSAASFEEVLRRQQVETGKGDEIAPSEEEADHFFVIKDPDEVPAVIQRIVDLEQRL